MYRFKRDMWKAGIAIAGVLLLLVFMMWLSAPAAGAQGGASGASTPGTATMQATPTVDATVTVLSKEQLTQQIKQLQLQNDRSISAWFWNVGTTLGTIVAALIAVVGVFATVRFNSQKELNDRQAERNKRAEERLKEHFEALSSIVTGLGDEKEGAKIGAAILLRTFLRPGYEQFYTPTFDLAVANLRLPRTLQQPEHPDAPLPLTTLSQALIVAFKESFPRSRKRMKEEDPHFNPQSLDASNTQLDNANLNFADLEQAWMPQAFLREANLFEANLSEANLAMANLLGANLIKAKLNGASLFGTNLSGAKLNEAKLNGASLFGTNLLGANLCRANLSKTKIEDALYLYGTDLRGVNGLTKEQLETCKAKGAIIDENPATLLRVDLSRMDLSRMDLSGADLTDAKLIGVNLKGARLTGARLVRADLTNAYLPDAHLHLADLSEAKLIRAILSGTDLSDADLNGAHIENAMDLRETNLRGVKGLTKWQLEDCKTRGAIIDEDPTTSSSQPTVAPLQPEPDNNAQAQSSSPTQGSVPTFGVDESSATSSKPSPEP